MTNPFIADADPGDENDFVPELELSDTDPVGEFDPVTELAFSVMMLQADFENAVGAIANALNMLRHAVLQLADGDVEGVKDFLAIPEAEDAAEVADPTEG